MAILERKSALGGSCRIRRHAELKRDLEGNDRGPATSGAVVLPPTVPSETRAPGRVGEPSGQAACQGTPGGQNSHGRQAG